MFSHRSFRPLTHKFLNYYFNGGETSISPIKPPLASSHKLENQHYAVIFHLEILAEVVISSGAFLFPVALPIIGFPKTHILSII